MLTSWTVRDSGRFSRAIGKASLEAKRDNPDRAFATLQKLIEAALQLGDDKLLERGLYRCLSDAIAAQADIEQQAGNNEHAEELLLSARRCAPLYPKATCFLAERFVSQGRTDDAAWEVFLDYCRQHSCPMKALPEGGKYVRGDRVVDYECQNQVVEYLRSLYEVTPDTPPAHFDFLVSRNQAICETGWRLPWIGFSVAYIAINRSGNTSALEECIFEIMNPPVQYIIIDRRGIDEPHLYAGGRTGLDKIKELAVAPDARPQARFYVARCLAGLNRCKEALDLLQTLDNELSSWWIYHFALATVYFRLGRVDASRRAFEETETKAGRTIGAVQLHLGHLAFQAADMASAMEYYGRACECAPEDWRGAYWLGKTKLIWGKLGEAIQLLGRAAELSNSPAPLTALAVAYEISGELAKAVSAYDRCLSCFPDLTVVLLRKGVCLARQGKQTEAMDCFSVAVTHDSVADAARFYWGLLSMEQKNFQQAIRIWGEITSEYWGALVRPDLASAQCILAETEFEKRRYSTAAYLWAESLPSLEDEEETRVKRNILEARFRSMLASFTKDDSVSRGHRLEELREINAVEDSPRGQYYSYLLSLAEGNPDQCDFLSLAVAEGLDSTRCRYHHAISQLQQGFFEEELLSEIVHGNNEYSVQAKHALLSGYLRGSRIPEALSTLTEIISQVNISPDTHRLEHE